jgi:hypothetical protein
MYRYESTKPAMPNDPPQNSKNNGLYLGKEDAPVLKMKLKSKKGKYSPSTNEE